MCFSVISSSAKRTEIYNQLNIVFCMLKIYLGRLEKEQKPPLSKARWHRVGAQQKVPALPLLRRDKGGNFFGKKTNPKKTQQTECFLFFFSHPPLLLLLRLFLVSFRIRERWVAEPGKGSSPTTLSPLQVLRGVGGGGRLAPGPAGFYSVSRKSTPFTHWRPRAQG